MVYNRNGVNDVSFSHNKILTERNLKLVPPQDAHQYPEEECDLKGVLEEDEVDQEQDDPRPPEPEVVIWWLYDQIALDRGVLLSYILG